MHKRFLVLFAMLVVAEPGSLAAVLFYYEGTPDTSCKTSLILRGINFVLTDFLYLSNDVGCSNLNIGYVAFCVEYQNFNMTCHVLYLNLKWRFI